MISHRHHLERQLHHLHQRLRLATTPGDPYARPELAGELERRIDALKAEIAQLAERPPAEIESQLELALLDEVPPCD